MIKLSLVVLGAAYPNIKRNRHENCFQKKKTPIKVMEKKTKRQKL